MTDVSERLRVRFETLAEDLSRTGSERYEEKKDEHGDSWKTCDRDYLEECMDGQYKKFKGALSAGDIDGAVVELADMTNFALFLLARKAAGVDG